MAGSLRAPLLLVAALALAITLAVSPVAGQRPNRPRLLGGLWDADVNEEGVQQALSFAMSEYNKASNDAFHSRAVQVVRAQKQVRSQGRVRGRGASWASGVDGAACAPGGRGPRDVTRRCPFPPAGRRITLQANGP